MIVIHSWDSTGNDDINVQSALPPGPTRGNSLKSSHMIGWLAGGWLYETQTSFSTILGSERFPLSLLKYFPFILGVE